MKRIFILLSFSALLAPALHAQNVGIGTTSPTHPLDVNGQARVRVTPSAGNTDSIILRDADGVLHQMSIARLRDIIQDTVPPSGNFNLNCAGATQSGTFIAGQSAAGQTITVPYTGGPGSAYGAINITAAGVTGNLTASAPAGTLTSGNLVLTVGGTPTSSGTAVFTLMLGGDTCTVNRPVNPGSPQVTSLSCGGTLTGTYTQGQAVSGTKVISYSGGNGINYNINVPSTVVQGLTASASGTLQNGGSNATIVLAIGGTPTSSGIATFTINLGGQNCSFTIPVNLPNPTLASCGTTQTYGTVTSSTGKVWLDRNLGASQAATSSTDYLAYGSLYQWGRGNDGHQCVTWTSSTTGTGSPIASGPVNTNTPGSSFITVPTGAPPAGDWRSPSNPSLWQGVSGINNPCPAGFRVPTAAEINAEFTAYNITNAATAYAAPHKFILSNQRAYTNGGITTGATSGVAGGIWTSTTSSPYGSVVREYSISNTNIAQGYGFPVRCIKN